jgi:hypothetical protein
MRGNVPYRVEMPLTSGELRDRADEAFCKTGVLPLVILGDYEVPVPEYQAVELTGIKIVDGRIEGRAPGFARLAIHFAASDSEPATAQGEWDEEPLPDDAAIEKMLPRL